MLRDTARRAAPQHEVEGDLRRNESPLPSPLPAGGERARVVDAAREALCSAADNDQDESRKRPSVTRDGFAMKPRLNRVAASRQARASMRGIVGLTFVALVAFGPHDAARAAGAAICNAYAKEAAAKAQGVRDLACGYDLKDPRWTTDRKSHSGWCRASPDKAVASEQAQRRAQMNLCQTCSVYADMAVEAAAENKKLNCGLSGPNWNDNKSDHFAWCMAMRDQESTVNPDVAAATRAIETKFETVTRRETIDRTLRIMKCKTDIANPPAARP
jgi:hypothetical protein